MARLGPNPWYNHMTCTPSSLGKGGGKIFRKVFAWGSEICVLVGGDFDDVGHGISKGNLKLHNPSIKSVFRITNLICFFALESSINTF